MLTKIKCPKCNTEGTFSISDAVYDGPYKCWKCRELLKIRMENGQLISVMPLDANEAAKLEEIRMMKEKFQHGGH
jgi:phage FluMu protein Com